MPANDRAVLSVEDNENAAFILQDAFEQVGLAQPLLVVGDGQKAIDYLAGKNEYADRARFPLGTIGTDVGAPDDGPAELSDRSESIGF